MKFVQKVTEGNNDRYYCPECGSTLVVCNKGDAPIIPDYCKHCGADTYYVEDCKTDDAE